MRVSLSARSHNATDTVVDRFGVRIPVGGSIEADLAEKQVAHLQADPWVTVTPIIEPEPETEPEPHGRRARA